MKAIITICIGLVGFTMLNAQNDPAKAIRSGKVVYEDKAKLDTQTRKPKKPPRTRWPNRAE
jgi:hypothetical protein